MDSIFKSIKDVETLVDLAITLEQTGRDFYVKLERCTTDEKLASLFSYLSSEEEKHLKMYRKLMEKITGETLRQDHIVGEYGMFIGLLASEVTKALSFEIDMNIKDAIEMALHFEKDTLLIFNEMKNLMNEENEKIVNDICVEEKRHIAKLIEYKSSLS